MKNAEKWQHPTKFTGDWPDWNGYTWLDWAASQNCHHPGEDYNFGYGDQDLGQDVVATASGIVFHTSKRNTGYGNLVILKHTLGYNLKRFIKETYGIETDELYSLYAHLKDILVATGNKLDAGALFAHVGKTGAKSPHLHFEIYSLWKNLKHTNYRFYPVGWSKEKIKENWLPAYQFIEATKNLESYEQFLGKSKDYWLAVEADRNSLLKQVGKKDEDFLKIKVDLDEKLGKCQISNQQLEVDSAKFDEKLKNADTTCKNKVKRLEEKMGVKDEKITNLKTRVANILSQQSEKIKLADALLLLFSKLKSLLGGGEIKND